MTPHQTQRRPGGEERFGVISPFLDFCSCLVYQSRILGEAALALRRLDSQMLDLEATRLSPRIPSLANMSRTPLFGRRPHRPKKKPVRCTGQFFFASTSAVVFCCCCCCCSCQLFLILAFGIGFPALWLSKNRGCHWSNLPLNSVRRFLPLCLSEASLIVDLGLSKACNGVVPHRPHPKLQGQAPKRRRTGSVVNCLGDCLGRYSLESDPTHLHIDLDH